MSNYQTENLLTQTFRLAHFHTVFFFFLFFSTEDSILSLFHIEHLTYRLSPLQIEHMFTQSFKLSHLRIEHLFTQNLHFRLSHLHIEHLFKQNSRSSYYYREHLFYVFHPVIATTN